MRLEKQLSAKLRELGISRQQWNTWNRYAREESTTRNERVDEARQSMASGKYDDQQVIDTAIEKMLDDLS
jgi:hypothetical protein